MPRAQNAALYTRLYKTDHRETGVNTEIALIHAPSNTNLCP